MPLQLEKLRQRARLDAYLDAGVTACPRRLISQRCAAGREVDEHIVDEECTPADEAAADDIGRGAYFGSLGATFLYLLSTRALLALHSPSLACAPLPMGCLMSARDRLEIGSVGWPDITETRLYLHRPCH